MSDVWPPLAVRGATRVTVTSAEPLHAQLADMRKRIQRLEDIALLLASNPPPANPGAAKLYWEFMSDITADRGIVRTPPR